MEQVHGRKHLSIQNTWHELGFAICKTPCFSNIRSRWKTFHTFWLAAIESKAKPTDMLTTAQDRPSSSITSAEEQKSMQNWRSSTRSHILILKSGHIYIPAPCEQRHSGETPFRNFTSPPALQGSSQRHILYHNSNLLT